MVTVRVRVRELSGLLSECTSTDGVFSFTSFFLQFQTPKGHILFSKAVWMLLSQTIPFMLAVSLFVVLLPMNGGPDAEMK